MSCKARPVPLPLRVSPVSLPFRLSSPLRGRGLCRCGCVCVSGRGCASDDVSGSPCSTSRPDTSPSPAALSPTSRSTCGSPLSPCGLPLRLPALPCTGLPLLLGRSPLLMLLRQGRLRSLARRLDRGSWKQARPNESHCLVNGHVRSPHLIGPAGCIPGGRPAAFLPRAAATGSVHDGISRGPPRGVV